MDTFRSIYYFLNDIDHGTPGQIIVTKIILLRTRLLARLKIQISTEDKNKIKHNTYIAMFIQCPGVSPH